MPLELYQSVLNQTQDLEIASLAALLLGEYYREAGDKQRAQEYLKNVFDANPNYFLKVNSKALCNATKMGRSRDL